MMTWLALLSYGRHVWIRPALIEVSNSIVWVGNVALSVSNRCLTLQTANSRWTLIRHEIVIDFTSILRMTPRSNTVSMRLLERWIRSAKWVGEKRSRFDEGWMSRVHGQTPFLCPIGLSDAMELWFSHFSSLDGCVHVWDNCLRFTWL